MAEPKKTSWFARWGFFIVGLGTAAAVAAGWGSRAGLWPFGFGFRLLAWAGVGALAGVLLSLIGVFATRKGNKRGRLQAILGVLLGLLVAGLPSWYVWKARDLPAIHDISTDTDHPPAFSAVTPLRRGSPNPVEYGGEEIADRQHRAYPDIQPLLMHASVDHAFEHVLEAAREMGWDIVDANPAQGRLEAMATTFWFGFKDDVVVRVSPTEIGSRIDVRSVSRVGRSDIGTNARRIRGYLAKLAAAP
ncbi:MAG: DUF1499 domain-containing protein [Nitrospirae bacterium]|nr:DUF1499 domain-containing protein [Nitrospirota bacterium]